MPALKAFEVAPAGSHLGTLYALVEFGTQYSEFEGRSAYRPQLYLGFELPDARTSSGKPFTIGRTYTFSSDPRAALRQDIEAWFGRALAPEELSGTLDLTERIGAVAVVGIKHDVRNSRTYANLVSLMKPPQGALQRRKLINPSVIFSLGEFTQEIYESLPEWQQRRITKSPEYHKLMGEPARQLTGYSDDRTGQGEIAGELDDELDDGIPF
jgi:hypothetical protein